MAGVGGVVVIVNPISGTGGRPEVARKRIEFARATLAARGGDTTLSVTEHGGHARELARAAVGQQASLVIAWGGDGTVNEVASELVFRDISLAIIPSGSGNGLSRELGIPFNPDAAFSIAFSGSERVIDAGEIDGHLFFNIAGLGLDARVAQEFAANGLVRRGFRRYLEIAVRELLSFSPDDHTVIASGVALHTRALVIAIANGRQYGNGALIAPQAQLDDGKLDLVIVEHRSLLATLFQAPMLFAGRVGNLPRVSMTTASEVQITSAHPVLYHVDGEPFVGGASIVAKVRPRALRVRVR